MNNEFPTVLFLETSELDRKDDLLEIWYDILCTCSQKEEIMAVLNMFYDDVTERTGKLIIERQIIDKVKQLNELRINSEFTV